MVEDSNSTRPWALSDAHCNTLLWFTCSAVSNSVPQGTAAHQASLSFTISLSLLRLMSIESMMASNHLILGHPLPLLPSIFPNIKVFSNELALCIRWKSTGASASVLPMSTQGLFCFTMYGVGYKFMISIGKNSLWDQTNVIAQVFTAV